MLHYNRQLKPLARALRSHMTDAENMLWSKLRRKQIKGRQFYRQKAIGRYIVDFYCPAASIVIELDGGQHYSDFGKEKDRVRDNTLMELGLRILRFSDRDIFENIDGVLERIWRYL